MSNNGIQYKITLEETERLFVERLYDTIYSYLRKAKSSLSIKLGFMVVKRDGLPFDLYGNPSFVLEGSFDIIGDVKGILNSANIDKNLKDSAILVKLTFDTQKESDLFKQTASSVNANVAQEGLRQFIPVDPKFSFEQIILPEGLKKEIFQAIKMLECKDLIYETWGYGKIEPVAKSILNFYGPAGTGKTMCAHAIANKLGKKLLYVNCSDIESQFVGASNINLKNAFDAASKTDSVIFFDEADSFLGKRIENVAHGGDQAVNSLRSQMLVSLEEYNGIVLFATNLVSNFDPAFKSRIQKHLRFELPNKEARIDIIKKQIPENLPLLTPITDEDFDKASEYADGFNGREIKNAMLDLYLSKADVNNPNTFFNGQDVILTMKRKKEEKEKLELERKEKLKQRITSKLEEKVEEDNAVKEYEEQKKLKDSNIK